MFNKKKGLFEFVPQPEKERISRCFTEIQYRLSDALDDLSEDLHEMRAELYVLFHGDQRWDENVLED